MGIFGDIISQAKDAGSGAVAEKVLRKHLADYGNVQDLSIDSRTKRLTLKILLKGETQTLAVLVDEYQVQELDGKVSVTIKKAAVNREWMNQALQDFLIGRPFPIPDKYASIVRMVL